MSNIVNLVSSRDGKAQSVSVYTGRAEVTRVFKFEVEEGQNQVFITGIPDVLERESLRVEGRGFATIHDVSVSETPLPPSKQNENTRELDDFRVKQKLVEKALERNSLSSRYIKSFMESYVADLKDPSKLSEAVDQFQLIGKKVDEERFELKRELARIQPKNENDSSDTPESDKLKLCVQVGLFAEKRGEVEIVLTYAVQSANWEAIYDIRADTQGSVILHYKARIVQNTGESWENVALTLETATPSYDSAIPKVGPWKIYDMSDYTRPIIVTAPGTVQVPGQWHHVFRHRSRSRSRSRSRRRSRGRSRSRSPMARRARDSLAGSGRSRSSSPRPVIITQSPIAHRAVDVLSKASKGVSATFCVPGTITILDDGNAHTVTVARLSLEAILEWICVPKVNNKVYLNSKIKNASDYTLIEGNANIYVDGTFISRTRVPIVSPQESFECAFGIDPSIRVTYHPRSKKTSQTGAFLSKKTQARLYSRRITVENTKAVGVVSVKVLDQIPVSETEKAIVKLIAPSLPMPYLPGNKDKERDIPRSDSKRLSGIKNLLRSDSSSLTFTNKAVVKTQWDGAEEADNDSDLGKDGKINFVCSLPPQTSVNLSLEWEVSYPSGMQLGGLD